MIKNIPAVRGMNDILPKAIVYWQHIEEILRRGAKNYGYQEIRFPIVKIAHTTTFMKIFQS